MEVGIFEARNRFSELVEAAERGEDVVITRRGRPTVRISSVHEANRRAEQTLKVLARADELRERIAKRLGRSFTHEEMIAARDEGRR